MKRIYHLRSQLMPYIYSSVWQVHNQSIPLNRAMYIEYPDKEEAYNNPQEFLFGDLLLSAPIVSPGTGDNLVSSQKVWFPEGDIWYNIFNNKKYQGGTTENVSADINEFPLFVKGGFPLPMQPYKQRMATAVLDTLIIRCYPGQLGAKNSYTLYEDDGISNEYLQGKTAFTNIHYQQKENGAEITIDAVQGAGYKDQPIKRTYLLELPTVKVKSAVVNGKKVKPMFNDKWQMDYILVSQLPINKTVVVRTNQ
jgi:alpha-glucosidase (family GH31 glycosyl hydrolase)